MEKKKEKTKEEIAFEYRLKLKEEFDNFYKREKEYRRSLYSNKHLFDLIEGRFNKISPKVY